ncbi:hypothetical protein F5Y03DRAFT_217275 [Xylaria venustula]|nr:hypothetical protein F5Y03DRAFT_217275 [Xylaria venustula]
MVFCAYCGRSFTRKEHLERHLPRHTNVKPYRCTECQLSFSRRDLLQRHHTTYHILKDPMEPTLGGNPPNVGRTQIACVNCSTAKTGCDKGSPCTRCREKGLHCEVRYARRTAKAHTRVSQAAKKVGGPMRAPTATPPLIPTLIPPPIDFSHGGAQGVPPPKLSVSPQQTPIGTIDPRSAQCYDSPLVMTQPADSQITPQDLLLSPGLDGMEGFLPYNHNNNNGNNDFMQQDTYPPPEFWSSSWPNGLMGDVYQNNQQSTQGDVSMVMFPDLSSLASSSSYDRLDSSAASTHTRSTSIISCPQDEPCVCDANLANQSDGPALQPAHVIATDAGWPIARCNPVIYSRECQRTAIAHLESLERKSKRNNTWDATEVLLTTIEPDLASVAKITPRTRDEILAVAQTYLHKALDIHRYGEHYPRVGVVGFLALPPARILEYFLRSYMRNLSFFYSLVSSGSVDPNEVIKSSTGTLLVLLMIAQGASVVPSEDARTLSIGLIEICRISLFDIIEKNVQMCADSTAHRCSLLFTLLGAWSGDKWLMDIAMGQRGMYLSMLKHAGMFESQPPISPSFDDPVSAWCCWRENETRNRLVYNWVMVDQELSLFHDTAPLLNISELCAPLPGPEELWISGEANQWMAAMQSNIDRSANANPLLPPSLFALFRDFLRDKIDDKRGAMLSPHQLRLLLHPLQSLLWYQREVMFCFSDTSNPRNMTSTPAEASSTPRHQGVQDLLQRWYKLSSQHLKENPTCVVSKTNLVLYHLISLNAVTNFPAIEQLARRRQYEMPEALEPPMHYGSYIHVIEETVYHCGQVIRLVRGMSVQRRPIWWSAAVYRALLILWAYSLLRSSPNFLQNPEAASCIAIDQVDLEDSALFEYLWGPGPKAVPVLSGPEGSTTDFSTPSEVLDYAVRMLRDGASTRFSDGIKRKLTTLNRDFPG